MLSCFTSLSLTKPWVLISTSLQKSRKITTLSIVSMNTYRNIENKTYNTAITLTMGYKIPSSLSQPILLVDSNTTLFEAIFSSNFNTVSLAS